uniref:Odorant receptor n=1 Tax=Heliconius melpomene rosina TaxID=171916 RepID=A0A1S5XXQ2_HELME|nr:olfactory receptor 64 [Heliconius melpomene rosina]
MKLVQNVNFSLIVTQVVFYTFGIWTPKCDGWKKRLFSFYSFVSFNFILGSYIIIQIGDLIQVWGNLSLMTGTIFLLLTNFSLSTKLLNTMWKQKEIQIMLAKSNRELSNENREMGKEIVKSCNRETIMQLSVFYTLSYMTVFGWAASAEKNELPLRAWYPYDTSKTPAYQLTYAHQSIAVSMEATINVCLDTLVTSLICQYRCQLRLLALSLRTLCDGLEFDNMGRLTENSNEIVSRRLGRCVVRHQTVLHQVNLLQKYFSIPILAQFTVSMGIICVSAYQLAFETTSLVRIISMVAYLMVMMLQVFLYCYQGNQLVMDSIGVSSAGFDFPWYACSIPIQKSLLILMMRTKRVARLTAGGFTELSLATFMAIIKASYTFFTVLQQVVET